MANFGGKSARRRKRQSPRKSRPKKGKGRPPGGAKALRSIWIDHSPVVRFVMVFGLLITAFYAFTLSDTFRSAVFEPLIAFNAEAAGWFIGLFYSGVAVNGDMIISSRFSISIARGCDAIDPTALFSAAVLSFPAHPRYKLPGLFAGVAVLLGANLVRIISLFVVGVHWNELFEIMHVEVWQFLFILLAIALWILWITWAFKRSARERPI